jgi:aspartate racemase
MAKKFLGILGGMGSEAGSCLLQRVIHHTPARTDQQHLEIMLYSNPGIPDRTASILNQGPPAEPELVRSVKLLERAGVECIIIGCVTSHHYVESLRQQVRPPILSVIEETAEHIVTAHPGRRRIGVLATTGTIRAEVFQLEFRRRALETVLLPDTDHQRLVMGSIYGDRGIKAGCLDDRNREMLLEASRMLVEDGAQAIVAGCTEIPLVLSGEVFGVPVIDTIDVLARGAVRFCNQETRREADNQPEILLALGDE